MSRPVRFAKALGPALAVAVLAAACGDDDPEKTGASDDRAGAPPSTAEPVIDPGDGGDYTPDIDPADFVDRIDNPYLPFAPGARWVYEGTSDGETERVEVVVTPDRRDILGISATVVRDTVSVDGQVIEDTFDWFAQDREGTVWYLGEDSKEYEDGEVTSTKGSWEAGVDGALPGIVMPGTPEVGDAYRQEYYAGEAEDLGEIIRLDDTAEVPFGSFADVLVTRDWNPLEPDVIEEKSYAPGVGLVLERKVRGADEVVELIEFTPGA